MTERQQTRRDRRLAYGLGPCFERESSLTGNMVPWDALTMDEKLGRLLASWCAVFWKRTGSGPRLARRYRKALIRDNVDLLTTSVSGR